MIDEKLKQQFSVDEVEAVGQKIKLLFGLIATLKPYRELINAIGEDADDRASYAVSAAVLDPIGYNRKEKEHLRVAKRSKLLVELMDILEKTDADVLEAKEDEMSMKKMGDLVP